MIDLKNWGGRLVLSWTARDRWLGGQFFGPASTRRQISSWRISTSRPLSSFAIHANSISHRRTSSAGQSTPQIAPYAFSLISNPSPRRVCDRDNSQAQLQDLPHPHQQTLKSWHIPQLPHKGLCQAHTLLLLQLRDFLLVLKSANHSSPKAGAHLLQVLARTMAIQILNRAKQLLLQPSLRSRGLLEPSPTSWGERLNSLK